MCATPAVPYPGETGNFEPVAAVSDVPEGGIVQRILAGGEAVCLINHEGRISAVSDICTHQHFSMSQGDLLPDGTLQCAWHGARYDCRTGEVKQIPAESPLPIYEVRIEGGMVFVGPRSKRDGARYEPSVAVVGGSVS